MWCCGARSQEAVFRPEELTIKTQPTGDNRGSEAPGGSRQRGKEVCAIRGQGVSWWQRTCSGPGSTPSFLRRGLNEGRGDVAGGGGARIFGPHIQGDPERNLLVTTIRLLLSCTSVTAGQFCSRCASFSLEPFLVVFLSAFLRLSPKNVGLPKYVWRRQLLFLSPPPSVPPLTPPSPVSGCLQLFMEKCCQGYCRT